MGHSHGGRRSQNAIVLAEYKEVVTRFRALTDIRFKLLTYLPLGTVTAAGLVSATNGLSKQPAISAFAFVVTLCIATYDKRNDQHYDELVSRAAKLETNFRLIRELLGSTKGLAQTRFRPSRSSACSALQCSRMLVEQHASDPAPVTSQVCGLIDVPLMSSKSVSRYILPIRTILDEQRHPGNSLG